jgi:hypothetical protein
MPDTSESDFKNEPTVHREEVQEVYEDTPENRRRLKAKFAK